MPAGKRGLGNDPLDNLLGDQDPPAPAARRKAPPTLPVKLDAALVERGRDAVWWLMHHGEPTATLKGLVERALAAELERIQAEHTGGESFPPMGPLPRGGRIHPARPTAPGTVTTETTG